MIEIEEWRDIEGYEGVYQVSNFGDIKSLARNIYNYFSGTRAVPDRLLKSCVQKNGYRIVSLYPSVKSKTFCIHRLVAQAFIPNPENKPEVNHINGIKTDNRVENLEWATSSENRQHAHDTGLKISQKGSECSKAKLNEAQVLEIRSIKTLSRSEIAEKFMVSKSAIDAIMIRRSWKHI